MDLIKYIPESLTEKEISLLKDAFSIAEKSGEILMRYFRKNGLLQSTKQNEKDIVTIADKESEAFIIDYIRSHFPTHGIISEESGSKNEDRDYRWIIDPLDGTTNFWRGLPVFCVSIALEYKEEAILGVVFAPYLHECFYAIKHKGAWLNNKLLSCSDNALLSQSVVATGMPYDRAENPDNNLQEINKIALCVRGLRRMGSAAIDLCYVAAGFFDAYWELNLNRWDIAAGQLIAKEAGAIVQPIRSDRNYSLLVSNSFLYPSLHKLLKNNYQ